MPKTDYNEPWFAVEDPPCELRRMVNDKDEEIPLTVANLTRAAVCVNACRGISQEVLERVADGRGFSEIISGIMQQESPNSDGDWTWQFEVPNAD